MQLQDKIDACLKVLGQKLGAKKCLYDSIQDKYTFYITSLKDGDSDYTSYSIARAELIEKIERN